LPKFCAKITIFINTGKEKMAHLKHYHRTAVRSILNHVKRTDNYSNPDIDMNRSKYNFSLTTHDPHEVYQKRLSEVHCLNRANVNTLSSWVITLPKGVKQADQRKFFEETVKFLQKRYGENNCVSAEVHYDETTPHLHYCFIPIVWDDKKKREKVDRKSIFTLKELKTFHHDLQDHIDQVLGYKTEILNGALKNRKNLSIRELKERTAQMYETQQKVINQMTINQKEFDKACALDYKALYSSKLPFMVVSRKFAHKIFSGAGYALALKDTEKHIETLAKNLGVDHYTKLMQSDNNAFYNRKIEILESRNRELHNENSKLKELLLKFVPNVLQDYLNLKQKKDNKIKPKGYHR
jgi:hypothetical protein